MPAPAAAPRQERRKSRRFVPEDVRVWVVSGEFEELYTTVNFARRLLNLGPKGACVETTGRLRPDVKLSVEVRFDKLNATLRAEARIMWVATEKEGAEEVHKAGLWFTGKVETTEPVRVFLEGGRPERIVAQKQAEYQELKRNSEARKQPAVRKSGLGRKLVLALFVLFVLYNVSFWGLVARGRTASTTPGISYRFLSAGPEKAGAEKALATFYSPLQALYRLAGIELRHEAP